tara:strand:- start:338 stop:520 length:183 start_codon:yes stop_codon:yes gene_type:complete
MNIEDRLNMIDHILLQTICGDLINGSLLTQEDDETIEILLTHMYEDTDNYEKLGVIIGKS